MAGVRELERSCLGGAFSPRMLRLAPVIVLLLLFGVLAPVRAAVGEDDVIAGGRSPDGRYELAMTGRGTVSEALVLRETKTQRVLASTGFDAPRKFPGLEGPFSPLPTNPRWSMDGTVVAFAMGVERHLDLLYAFRIAGRSVRPVRIQSPKELFPLGWVNGTDLVCEAGTSATILRFRGTPLSARAVASTFDNSPPNTAARNVPPQTYPAPDGGSDEPLEDSRSPDGRYELVNRVDKSGVFVDLIVRDRQAGKNIFTPELLPRGYRGMEMPPGPVWSANSRLVVFAAVVDGRKDALLGFSVTSTGVPRPIRIRRPENLSPLGWINARDLVCESGGANAVILRFDPKSRTAAAIASTYKANRTLMKQLAEEKRGSSMSLSVRSSTSPCNTSHRRW